jgi:predicted  nucleic acid-binding Zn-ribbon protein
VPDADRLLELQRIDSDIDRLESRREQLEAGEEVSAARGRTEEAESALGELRLALDESQRIQSRLEHEIDTMNQKAAAEEKRLYDGSVANAKELEAIQHEIRSIRDRRSRTEDELLEVMERREELDGRTGLLERDVTVLRDRLEEIGGESAHELDRIASDLDRQRAAREALTPEIDEELLELYADLRRQKKGVAVASLVDGVCQACHEQLSALELARLKKTDGVKRCEHCRRILVVS